ncbi:helix-turn-helix transcriptional regulator [Nereida sp. MMG025]|uniref:ArsR/SmtB family transcription factor n=1 Tax=Nereida sp. MMG025 TaxID=2909981 RepID=UPI001F0113D7|nr:metalloregulator ArsR/SmtB family transcription factor [Nereida sp. MMG025]MCF6445594.1 metalloregulator ArsR/SmtB family transcription factor [Nereida sp. MMG025]
MMRDETLGLVERLGPHADKAASLFKALAHESRLMILCHLEKGERSVGELEKLLHIRQSAVSQQLSRLREDGLVEARRDGKTVYYSLKDGSVMPVLGSLSEALIYLPI